ncbi:hypothetical protein MN0502_02510 [Arthrobacter sp. MN05-02]|nr:hypothetical protein MN0502_02510 [Arthrobacter sp. MN05-02]
MDELAAFILARIEEDEVLLTGGDMMPAMAEERLLAECEAKRRLIAHVQRIEWNIKPVEDQNYMRRILELLALPWIGHPEYDTRWDS